MINNNPIGLFDSGIGGTSIWKEINAIVPDENCIYLADSKNAPYGQRTKDEIIALCCKNTEFLLDQNCKLIVVACNTATTNAISELRAKYNVPFIGIEPAIKPAAINSKTHKIGILATQGTLNSALFHENVAKFNQVQIIEQVGHGLVQLIEHGDLKSDEIKKLLHQYLQPMIVANVDYLVLGCSHYPYLIPEIKKIVPSSMHIIDSGEAVAKQTYAVLQSKIGFNESLNPSKQVFYTNGNVSVLQSILNNKHTVLCNDF